MPIHRSRTLFATLFLTVPVLLAFPGCTAATEDPAPADLRIVQGNMQVAAAGTLLATPVVMRVLDASGMPLQGKPISFAVTAGGGSVDPATATSDANGEAKARWTLGPGAQIHSLAATVPGLDPVSLSATGIVASDLMVAQGNNQTAKAGAALPVQIVLRVEGGASVPIPGMTVALSITNGSGSVSPQSAVTNALGEVTVRWTLGNQAGLQSATASAGNLAPVTISAVAN
jgi:adhesin/invasin